MPQLGTKPAHSNKDTAQQKLINKTFFLKKRKKKEKKRENINMFRIFLIPFFPLWERKLTYMMLDSNLLFFIYFFIHPPLLINLPSTKVCLFEEEKLT